MGQDSWKNEKSTQMFCVQNALHSLNTKGPYDINVKILSDKLRKGPWTMQKKKKKPKRLWTFSKWAETVISVLKCCSLRILGQCIVMRMASGELLFYRLASQPFMLSPPSPSTLPHSVLKMLIILRVIVYIWLPHPVSVFLIVKEIVKEWFFFFFKCQIGRLLLFLNSHCGIPITFTLNLPTWLSKKNFSWFVCCQFSTCNFGPAIMNR